MKIDRTLQDTLSDARNSSVRKMACEICCAISAFILLTSNLSAAYSFAHLSYKNGTAKITSVSGGGDIIIPDEVDGHRVVELSAELFWANENVTSVTLPEAITKIPISCFAHCINLTNVTAKGVVEIGADAFRCTLPAKIVTVDVNDALSVIGPNAFEGHQCDLFFTWYRREWDYYTRSYVYYGYYKLPESLEEIGDKAFVWGNVPFHRFCWPKRAIKCGYSFNAQDKTPIIYVQGKIGLSAFLNTELTHEQQYSYDCSIGRFELWEAPAFGSDPTVQIQSYTVPQSVYEVPPITSGWQNLTNVVFHDFVVAIGTNAMTYTGIQNLELPQSLKFLRKGALKYCQELQTLTLGHNIERVEEGVLSYIPNLASVSVPSCVEQRYREIFPKDVISKFSVHDCSACGHHRGVVSAWTYTVKDGNAIITDVPSTFVGDMYIPAVIDGYTVTSVGDNAFNGCTGLTSVVIANGVRNLGYSAFRGCTGLRAITIPSGVESIGECAFYSCTNLTSITIPSSVKTIGNLAFNECESLTSVTIPQNLTSIGNYAFAGCSSLNTIAIPASVVSIGCAPFAYCDGLQSIKIDPDNVAFCVIDGILYDKAASRVIQCIGTKEGFVMVPDGVVTVGVGAFSGCCGITGIRFLSGLGNIGQSAFQGCCGLSAVSIPASVTNIDSLAFYGCDKITSVTMPSRFGLATIFPSSRKRIKNVTFPSGEMRVSGYVFDSCSAILEVTIPEGVTNISSYAFKDCGKLTTLTMPSTVLSIGKSAFYGCSSLSVVQVSNNGDIDALKQMISDAGYYYLANSLAFRRVHNVYFDAHGGVCLTDSKVYMDGSLFGTLPEAIRDGYSLEGWYTTVNGGTQVYSSTKVSSDATLHARWTQHGGPCTVSFDVGGYVESPCSVIRNANTAIGTLPVLPMRYGYGFVGWFTSPNEGEQVNSSTVVIGDTKFYARWELLEEQNVEIPASESGGAALTVGSRWVTSDIVNKFGSDRERLFYEKFGSNFTEALSSKTGKRDGAGNELRVWHDYVAGTDPTDSNSTFKAMVRIEDGRTIIEWEPNLNSNGANRTYTIYGKENLGDLEWMTPTNAFSRFFKVDVAMPKEPEDNEPSSGDLFKPFLNCSEQTIWEGVNLSNITNITAELSGRGINDGTNAVCVVGCCFKDESDGASVQFQVELGEYIKCVKVRLKQDGTNVSAYVQYAACLDKSYGVGVDFDDEDYTVKFVATYDQGEWYGVKQLHAYSREIQSPLLHRWSFSDNLQDSVTLCSATAVGDVVCNPASVSTRYKSSGNSYIDLGDDLLPTNGTAFTLEFWVSKQESGTWGRIFAFGSMPSGVNFKTSGTGTGFESHDRIELCWNGSYTFGFPGTGENSATSGYLPCQLQSGCNYYIAAVYAPGASGTWAASFYVYNADTHALLGKTSKDVEYADWDSSRIGRNDWVLGQALTTWDMTAANTYDEVRIWGQALDAKMIAESVSLGPDVLPTVIIDTNKYKNTVGEDLAHRWSFNGNLNDSVGNQTASAVGSVTVGTSQYTLSGGSRGTSYIDLGDDIIPVSTNGATIELWATRLGSQNASRIFDIGSGTANYLFWSWQNGSSVDDDSFALSAVNSNTDLHSGVSIVQNKEYHLSVVIKPVSTYWEITYVKRDASTASVLSTTTISSSGKNWSPSMLGQTNCWLGHSQWSGDRDANASYNEVRVWKRALSDDELTKSAKAGPDTLAL